MRPIRKRGYFRAVKRGEKWAVEIERKRGPDPYGFEIAFYFRWADPEFWRNAMKGEWLLNSVPKDNWAGGYITIPLVRK